MEMDYVIFIYNVGSPALPDIYEEHLIRYRTRTINSLTMGRDLTKCHSLKAFQSIQVEVASLWIWRDIHFSSN